MATWAASCTTLPTGGPACALTASNQPPLGAPDAAQPSLSRLRAARRHGRTKGRRRALPRAGQRGCRLRSSPGPERGPGPSRLAVGKRRPGLKRARDSLATDAGARSPATRPEPPRPGTEDPAILPGRAVPPRGPRAHPQAQPREVGGTRTGGVPMSPRGLGAAWEGPPPASPGRQAGAPQPGPRRASLPAAGAAAEGSPRPFRSRLGHRVAASGGWGRAGWWGPGPASARRAGVWPGTWGRAPLLCRRREPWPGGRARHSAQAGPSRSARRGRDPHPRRPSPRSLGFEVQQLLKLLGRADLHYRRRRRPNRPRRHAAAARQEQSSPGGRGRGLRRLAQRLRPGPALSQVCAGAIPDGPPGAGLTPGPGAGLAPGPRAAAGRGRSGRGKSVRVM